MSGENDKANTPAMKSHKYSKTNFLELTTQGLAHAPTITHKNQEPQTITHNEEKIALVLALASGFAIWNMFR